MSTTLRCALIQAPPVFLNLEASVERALDLLGQAHDTGAELIAFGETWLTGYPVWIDSAPRAGIWGEKSARALYRRLFEQSPELQGPQIDRIHHRAHELGCDVVLGIHERSGNTLYNTLLMLSRDGESRVHRRKLVPTYTERTIWGRGDGSTLDTLETPYGRVGGMICWEHWMPALRQTMHARHEVIHIAQWPTAHELHQLASRQYAFEGGCFVLCCGTTLTKSQVLEGYRSLGTDAGYELLESIDDEQLMSGGAAIIGPDTQYIGGPAGPDVEIVSAEFDPGITAESGLLLDTDGHYSRPDIFTLKVNRTAQVNVTEDWNATGE
jgi:predicted amidohydrolase